MQEYQVETKCVQSGYTPGNGEPRFAPIVQSTTFKYDDGEQVGKLFNLESDGYFYSRLANPTVDVVEKKINDLEGGVGAICCSSGMAAIMLAIMNIVHSGEHIIATNAIYGGSFNLLNVTLRKLGIDTTFVPTDISEEELRKVVQDNTRLIYSETLTNPGLEVIDIEMFARVAHDNHIPLCVDNTFATPVHCRPIEYGADLVVHSTSKYMDGHAVAMGGCVVDSGNFDWTSGKFPEFTEPDESYHGVIYTKQFGRQAYITKARVQVMRDTGMIMSPNTAFLLNLGLDTLALRMERHSSNALKVARYLQNNSKVEKVFFPELEGDKYYNMAQKYMPKGSCGVVSFIVKGGRESAMKFMAELKLAMICVHVADARTCILHPASSTHRQMSDEQLMAAGIEGGQIRLSVGIENVEDIIADLEQGFAAI
ncbi:MAG: O-acetylhomoserine aminocarboxypropyltransferase/cysteine synthase [Lachnospiraceae bacterium]|nr:O-acetylhomoserine aminocarboxypropyltransferase/cysteine synthase [Lachnospiraceae bacterium]